jgi:hypothetical protein
MGERKIAMKKFGGLVAVLAVVVATGRIEPSCIRTL